ncbi:hypothetical protein PQD74_gp017 [Stenotrophomonas phage Siara]|uniref:Uncharacterized protein n=1 Tax=Stenotrophomonas phage Siara TaxID=2859658 RepID=A0AAE8BHX6_9CAUD|nr:hypothetical protein PQD74_gp017 [Stenotrophomonas phage Siara]QYW02020.1 hypothetical protein CPT_Siara_017 [Stenotrophomonas phage Siara]
MSNYHICEPGKKPCIHPARYTQLMEGVDVLAQYEIRQGWHFCPQASDMLIVRNSVAICTCHSTEEVNAWLDEKVVPLVGAK